MSQIPLYTIGYSGVSFDEFVNALKRHRIDVVADVRSQPFSRFSPDFSKKELENGLYGARIKYVFLGKELGARRDEPECYVDGRASYPLVEKTAAFRQGIDRLLDGVRNKGLRVVLLCAEKDPVDCHRFMLVCHHLKRYLPDIRHIVGGQVETNAQTEARLLARYKKTNRDLFRSDEEVLEEVYLMHGEKIAYDASDAESEAAKP